MVYGVAQVSEIKRAIQQLYHFLTLKIVTNTASNNFEQAERCQAVLVQRVDVVFCWIFAVPSRVCGFKRKVQLLKQLHADAEAQNQISACNDAVNIRL